MPTVKEATHERITSSFAGKGFQLTDVLPKDTMSLEDTIIGALRSPTPRLLEGIPILLAKNEVNYSHLKNQIDKYQLWNEFGYLGEFALKHIEDSRLKNLVNYCGRNLKPSSDPLGYSQIYADARISSDEWKKWNISGVPSYVALQQQFGRYHD